VLATPRSAGPAFTCLSRRAGHAKDSDGHLCDPAAAPHTNRGGHMRVGAPSPSTLGRGNAGAMQECKPPGTTVPLVGGSSPRRVSTGNTCSKIGTIRTSRATSWRRRPPSYRTVTDVKPVEETSASGSRSEYKERRRPYAQGDPHRHLAAFAL